MKKFVAFVSGADDAAMYPLENLRGLAVTADATILMTFNSFRNGTADLDRDTVTLTITADKEKEVLEAIAKELATGRDSFALIADDVNSKYIHADITSITIAYAS
tara:strand:- start:46 stop:360 length:315 start_codon:yes stop_codon:yes gene_type:complete